MLMRMLTAMLRLVPQGLAKNMTAPMMAEELLARGRDHPTIPMTLANLLLCACPVCPSFPAVRGEALYCSGGKSGAAIKEEGCNCVVAL